MIRYLKKVLRFLRWVDRLSIFPRKLGTPKPRPVWNRQGSFRL